MNDDVYTTCFSLSILKKIARHFNDEFIERKEQKINLKKCSKEYIWRSVSEKIESDRDCYYPIRRDELFKGKINRITDRDIRFFFTNFERDVGADRFNFGGTYSHSQLAQLQNSQINHDAEFTVFVIRDLKRPRLLTFLAIDRRKQRVFFFDPRGFYPCRSVKRLMKHLTSSAAQNFKESVSRQRCPQSAYFNVAALIQIMSEVRER